MRFGKVEYEKRDGIAILTLDEQTRLNALSTAIREGLIKGFEEVEREEEVRVAIITGAGRAFCAGADITGLELAISCDIIIASEKAQFGVPEIKIGLLPGFAIVRLHQVIGRHKAKELVLTGDPISAEEASRIGLVNKVVQHEKLLDEAGGEEIVYSLDSMPFLFSRGDGLMKAPLLFLPTGS